MNKTISLELAKKLKEVADKKGYKLPESHLEYRMRRNIGEVSEGTTTYQICESKLERQLECTFLYPAYTTDELLEILPEELDICNYNTDFSVNKSGMFFTAGYYHENSSDYYEVAESPSEALGKLYLYLIDKEFLGS